MNTLLKKTLTLLTGDKVTANRPLKELTDRELIEMEAKIGGELFGPIPSGNRREFFRLDDSTWVWHEEWVDETGHRRVTTTRYEIHQNGVLKAQDGTTYRFIEGQELRNLTVAAQLYYEAVARTIYRRDPVTGRPLSSESAATI